jgi:thiamine-phosphate pyrophosphorylase
MQDAGYILIELPKLYVIADRSTLDARGISVGTFAAELAQAGVRLVQYRDKMNGPQEVLRAAALISAAFAGHEVTLVMNDRADLAKLAGWSSVHVGQGDLPVCSAKRLVRSVGISTHNGTQVLEADAAFDACELDGAAASADLLDYLATGPVFATGTKKDAEPVVGLEGVRRARELTSRPLVAIGGITRENARSVLEAGADSVAVISGLFVPGMTVAAVVEDFLQRLR